MNKKICIITGANGAVGTELSIFFKKQNWEVICLSRSKDIKHKYFDLKNPYKSINYIKYKADLLIHCAYDFKSTTLNLNNNLNISGSKKLFLIAKNKKIKKIINISTLSAFAEAKSNYGKIKYEIEKIANKNKIINLRLGLFKSKKSKIYSKIIKIAKYGYIVPLIGDGHYKLHITTVKCLNEFFINLNRTNQFYKLFLVCNKSSTTLKKLLFNKKLKFQFFLKINLKIILLFFKIIEKMNVSIGFTKDNLYGLINYNNKIKSLKFHKNI
jgi:dTDP-4-dehydrorhamnose reductase